MTYVMSIKDCRGKYHFSLFEAGGPTSPRGRWGHWLLKEEDCLKYNAVLTHDVKHCVRHYGAGFVWLFCIILTQQETTLQCYPGVTYVAPTTVSCPYPASSWLSTPVRNRQRDKGPHPVSPGSFHVHPCAQHSEVLRLFEPSRPFHGIYGVHRKSGHPTTAVVNHLQNWDGRLLTIVQLNNSVVPSTSDHVL